MDLKRCNFKHLYIKNEKQQEGFRVIHRTNQLKPSLFFHSILIHFSHVHYPLQTVKRTITKKPSTMNSLKTPQMLIKLGNAKEDFHSFFFYCNYLQS